MGLIFLYNNLADSATLTESSQDADFPAENIQHPFRTKVWRTTGGGTETLDFDLGSAQSVTCCALIDYTWTSAPGTLRFQWDDASDYSSINATETLTWVANPTTIGNRGTIIKTFTSNSYRYVRLDVVYATGDFDLGRVFLGTYFEPTISRSMRSRQTFTDLSYHSYTPDGQIHSDEIGLYRQKEFDFLVTTQAQWESYQTMFNNVGTFKDFLIAFDYDNEPGDMTWYGRFVSVPSIERITTTTIKVTCQFRESV